ncbi:MAG TPA: hypothetical protein PL066_03455 [bacterium]|nr:hypothetical protein [bacterium]
MVLSDAEILKQLNETEAQMERERLAKEAGVKEALGSMGTAERVVDEGLGNISSILDTATGGHLDKGLAKKVAIEFVLAKLEGKTLDQVSLVDVEAAKSSFVEDRRLGELANIPEEFRGDSQKAKLSEEQRGIIIEQISPAIDDFLRSLDVTNIVDMSNDNPNKVEDVKKLLLGGEKK